MTFELSDAAVTDIQKCNDRLRYLAHVLRHRDLWPTGFEWDYTSCYTCAMGLTFILWGQYTLRHAQTKFLIEWFAMPEWDVLRIFAFLGREINVSFNDITPEHVADAIERYLSQDQSNFSTIAAKTY